MMNANNRAAYARRIEQISASIRLANQYLQMNEMRFGNRVRSLRGLIKMQNPSLNQRIRRIQIINYLQRRTPRVRPRIHFFLITSTDLLSKLQWIDFYLSFLNEPPQLLQKTRDVVVELQAVIERLENQLDIINWISGYILN